MLSSYITTINPINNEPLSVISNSNVLWSSGNEIWNGLTVERHRFAELDAPEFVICDYSIVIHLSPSVSVESKIKGCFKSQIVYKGNISIFSAGAPRQFRVRENFETLVITLPQNALNKIGDDTQNITNPELIEHLKLRDSQILHIAMALKAEVETGYSSDSLYGESLGLALSAHLLARYSVFKPNICDIKGGIAPCRLRRVLEYIHDNLGEDLHLSKLAEIAGLSHYRFSHNFKRTTGIAPYQYVIRERIKRAKRLLRETDTTILEIANRVGCDNPSRFAMLFQRQTGVTPSVYRASFK